MKLIPHILPDADAAAQKAATYIANLAHRSVSKRSRFLMAVSGGETPVKMFEMLAAANMPWSSTHIFQVDERIAPLGDADRNLTSLQEHLLAHVPMPAQHIYPMPVEAHDLDAAAQGYAEILRRLCGTPPVFDLVHLGLGADGHTASLVPGDPVLDVQDADVAMTDIYQHHRRMTLTYPCINRSRGILWLVTGRTKAQVLARLCAGDTGIPAGLINQDHAQVFTDQSAGKQVS